MSQRMYDALPYKLLVEYVAEALDKLPPCHPANRFFGQKMRYGRELDVTEQNVYLFSFPANAGKENDNPFDIPYNITLSTKPAVCVVPSGGSAPRYAMGAVDPGFEILVRHTYHGRAMGTAQSLLEHFNLRTQVFPQNGQILATQSQAYHMFSSSGDKFTVYVAPFRVMAAENIH